MNIKLKNHLVAVNDSQQQVQSPIFINLSGEYHTQKNPDKSCTRLLNDDTRLAELDAFLHTLDNNLRGTDTTKLDKKLEDFLTQVAKTLTKKVKKSTIELEVASVLTPSTNEMSYTFKFNILDNTRTDTID